MVCSFYRQPGHKITKCQAPGAEEKRQELKEKREKRKSTSSESSPSSTPSLTSSPTDDASFNAEEAVFVVFDLETTGTNVNTDRIVQIAYEVWYKRKKIKSYSKIVASAMTSCAAAARVHGISLEQMSFGVTLRAALRHFCTTLRSYDSTVVLVAHNIKFDASILSRELARAQQEALSHDESISNMKIPLSLLCLDTLPLLSKTFPDLPTHKLGSVYQHLFHEELEGAHDAASDTAGLASILLHSAVFCNLDEQELYQTWEVFHRKADGLTVHRCRKEIFAAGCIDEDELSDVEQEQDESIDENMVSDNGDETVTTGNLQ